MTKNLYTWRYFSALLISCLTLLGGSQSAYANCPDGVSQNQLPLLPSRSVRKSVARLTEWPWLAAIQIRDPVKQIAVNLCAGAVIAPNWILTAAHCVADVDEKLQLTMRHPLYEEIFRGDLEIVIGVDDLRAALPENTFRAKRVVIHEAYLQTAKDRPERFGGADIALIQLSENWAGSLAVLSGRSTTDPVTDSLMVAGFGSTALGRDGRGAFRAYRLPAGGQLIAGCAQLMQISLPQIPITNCRNHFGNVAVPLGREQMCAGFSERNVLSPCDGDGGAPLVAFSAPLRTRPYLVGVTSWGEAACGMGSGAQVSGNYTVFTRISQFTDWIRKHADSVNTLEENPRAAKEQEYIAAALADLDAELSVAKGRVNIGVPEGSKLAVGTFFQLKIATEVPGKLIVLDIDANNRVTQLFPNAFLSSRDAELVKPGVPLILPDTAWGFPRFQVSEPLGESKLLVLVTPTDFAHATVGEEIEVQKRNGLIPASNSVSYLMNLSQQVGSRVGTSKDAEAINANWAYSLINYEVVPGKAASKTGR